LQQKIAAIAALGVTFTAFAQHDNKTWPFVTMVRSQKKSHIRRECVPVPVLESINQQGATTHLWLF
jgi:hypothetical protein